MSQHNSQWQQKLTELTQKYQLSEHAIMVLWQALIKGNGKMAQFNHPELGGVGQWLPGGLTMISDMSNSYLKMVIDNLCGELSILIQEDYFNPIKWNEPLSHQGSRQQQQQSQGNIDNSEIVKAHPFNYGPWWPIELGAPTLSGSQNGLLYAYFAHKQRLVLEKQGEIFVYNTLHHQVIGVSQQQSSSGQLLVFTSPDGTFAVADLPLVSSFTRSVHEPSVKESNQHTDIIAKAEKIKEMLPRAAPKIEPLIKPADESPQPDIFSTIKKLAELKEQGIISEQEFEAKKTELLSRL
jgi:Short C-terminal domain